MSTRHSPLSLWKFFTKAMSKSQGAELKVVKPSDTRWLSHEKCVSAVRKCYGAIVTTLESIYEESQ